VAELAEADAFGQVDSGGVAVEVATHRLGVVVGQFQGDGARGLAVGPRDAAGRFQTAGVGHRRQGHGATGGGGDAEVHELRQVLPVFFAETHAHRNLAAVAVDLGQRRATQRVAHHAGDGGGFDAETLSPFTIDRDPHLFLVLVVITLDP